MKISVWRAFIYERVVGVIALQSLTEQLRLPAGKLNPWTPERLVKGDIGIWVGANIAAAGAYFALAFVVSRFFAVYGLFPAPIWLPASAAVVAAMIGEWRMFPGIFLGSFLCNGILFAPPLYITTIISITNALGPVLSAVVLRSLRPERGLFTSFTGVIVFFGCITLLSPAVSATGGAIAVSLGQPFDLGMFYSLWVGWWLTDSGGTLYLAPALILWLGLEKESEAHTRFVKHRFDRQDLMVWALVAIGSTLLFVMPPLRGSYIRSAFPFLLVVPLAWIALKMSLRAAYTLVTLVSIIAAAGTVAGFGPFQDLALANPLQLVGTLVVLLAMNVLTIVALVSERHEAVMANINKTRFLADASHELRTPLNVIFGASSMMEDRSLGSVPSKEYSNYVRMIQQSSEYLLQLIDDLTQISKIEAGRFDLKEDNVDLVSIVKTVVDPVGIQARAKGITLNTDVPSLILKADPRALRQILLNLLTNAVKFTPEGGRVGIVARIEQSGSLVISVTDTGMGIPPEALGKVFDPFERGHGEQRSIEGTGLGLSIVRRLVTMHGGSVELTSEVGKGTMVMVTLPASRILREGGPVVPPPRGVSIGA
jgi:signal transduction histidine kinase